MASGDEFGLATDGQTEEQRLAEAWKAVERNRNAFEYTAMSIALYRDLLEDMALPAEVITNVLSSWAMHKHGFDHNLQMQMMAQEAREQAQLDAIAQRNMDAEWREFQAWKHYMKTRGQPESDAYHTPDHTMKGTST